MAPPTRGKTQQNGDNRQYNSSPVKLGGTPNSFRSLRRMGALSRLFQFQGQPITAIAFDNGKLLFGFNSPPASTDLELYKVELQKMVKERLIFIKNYFDRYKSEGNKINHDDLVLLALELNNKSRQSSKHPFEYPVKAVFADFSKVYDALTTHESPLTLLNKNASYFHELLMNTGLDAENAQKDYERLINDEAFRESHDFFREDSLESLYFPEALKKAIADENIEIVVQPQIIKDSSYETVHGEIAISNHILLNEANSKKDSRPNYLIGISRLNCADCANHFYMLNQTFDEYERQTQGKENKYFFPVFYVEGTHLCQYANLHNILPSWLFSVPLIAEIFSKEGYDKWVERAQNGQPTIFTTPTRGKGLVPKPLKSSEDVANSTLASIATDAHSPYRTNITPRANNATISPLMNNYQSINNELRVKIRDLKSEQKVLMETVVLINTIQGNLKKLMATDVAHQESKNQMNVSLGEKTDQESDYSDNHTSANNSPGMPSTPISKKKQKEKSKGLEKDKLLYELMLTLDIITDPITAQSIQDRISRVKSLPDDFVMPYPEAKKYTQLMQTRTELQFYYKRIEKLASIENQLEQCLNEQSSSYQGVCRELDINTQGNTIANFSAQSPLSHRVPKVNDDDDNRSTDYNDSIYSTPSASSGNKSSTYSSYSYTSGSSSSSSSSSSSNASSSTTKLVHPGYGMLGELVLPKLERTSWTMTALTMNANNGGFLTAANSITNDTNNANNNNVDNNNSNNDSGTPQRPRTVNNSLLNKM